MFHDIFINQGLSSIIYRLFLMDGQEIVYISCTQHKSGCRTSSRNVSHTIQAPKPIYQPQQALKTHTTQFLKIWCIQKDISKKGTYLDQPKAHTTMINLLWNVIVEFLAPRPKTLHIVPSPKVERSGEYSGSQESLGMFRSQWISSKSREEQPEYEYFGPGGEAAGVQICSDNGKRIMLV